MILIARGSSIYLCLVLDARLLKTLNLDYELKTEEQAGMEFLLLELLTKRMQIWVVKCESASILVVPVGFRVFLNLA